MITAIGKMKNGFQMNGACHGIAVLLVKYAVV